MTSALKAAAWGYAGTIGKLLVQLGSQIIIARILGPEDYGKFAVGALIVSLSSYVAEAGIGSALVQREKLDNDTISFIFSVQTLIGIAMSAAIWICAELLGPGSHQNDATRVVQLMGLACILNAAASTPNNLLRRALDYKRLQGAQLAGFGIGYLIFGVTLAYAGCGVWSLVTAWLIQSSVSLIASWRMARPTVTPRITHKDARSILLFGFHATVSNIANWCNGNSDKIIIANNFTLSNLGLYNAASNILSTLITQILSTIQSIIFSATSRKAEDKELAAEKYLALQEAGLLFLVPLFFGISAFDDTLLKGIYGHQWVGSGPLIEPLSIGISAYGAAGLITPLLWANNRIDKESRLQVFSAGLMLTAVSIGAVGSRDIATTAWVACACLWLRLLLITINVTQWLDLAFTQVLRIIISGTIISFIVKFTAKNLRTYLEKTQAHDTNQLIALTFFTFFATVIFSTTALAINGESKIRKIFAKIYRKTKLHQ